MKIVVSGLSGTGVTTLARSLAKYFNLEYVSTGEMFQGLAVKKFPEYTNGQAQNLLENSIKSIKDLEDEKRFIDYKMVNKLINGDGFILDSKYAWHYARSLNGDDIRILLICKNEERVKRLAYEKINKNTDLSKKKAGPTEQYMANVAEIIKARDYSLAKKFSSMYKTEFTINDGRNHHLVIDTKNTSIERTFQESKIFIEERENYKKSQHFI